jgi:hypothetical protein
MSTRPRQVRPQQLAREARARDRKTEFDLAISEGRMQVRQMTAAERVESDSRRGQNVRPRGR